MEEQIRQLVYLQQIDNDIQQVKVQAQETPRRLAGIDLELQAARQTYETFLNRLEEVKKQRRGLEREVEQIDQKIKKSRTKLMEVKNNKEYKAMLTEIDELNKSKGSQEDSLLELMERMEALTLQVRDQKKFLDLKIAAGKTQKEDWEKAGEGYSRELARLEEDRKKAAALVENSHLQQYEFLRDRLRGLALVEVRNAACMSCHMQIPQQLYNEIQRCDRIINCPNCLRILFYSGKPEAAKE
jgi:predicted  nucleic acid-binding Zn-ribbon protein